MARRDKRGARRPVGGKLPGTSRSRPQVDELIACDDWSLVAPDEEKLPELSSSPKAQTRLRAMIHCQGAEDEAAGLLAEALWSKKHGHLVREYLQARIKFMDALNRPKNPRLHSLLAAIRPRISRPPRNRSKAAEQQGSVPRSVEAAAQLLDLANLARISIPTAQETSEDLRLVDLARAEMYKAVAQLSARFRRGGRIGRRDLLQGVIDDIVSANPEISWIEVFHKLRRLADSHHPVVEDVTEDKIFWAGHRSTAKRSLQNRVTKARRLLRQQ
jgi:hypothetical protein